MDVPFVIADATSLTQAGYVGDDVESILFNLYKESGYVNRLFRVLIGCLDVESILINWYKECTTSIYSVQRNIYTEK